jgi:hypothetical protein
MNQIQAAIARVSGLDEVYDAQEQELQFIADTMEHLISDNQMLQRQIEDLDYLNLFEMNQIQEVLPIRDRKNTLLRLRRLRHDNPLAKQAVKLIVRFTLGKGVQWVLASEPKEHVVDHTQPPEPPALGPDGNVDGEKNGGSRLPPPPTRLVSIPRPARAREDVVPDAPVDGSDQTRNILIEFWNDPDNKLAFTTHKSMQQMLDDMVTDGEKFYACFEGDAAPYVKVTEIPIEEISQVIYHPDNRLKPVFYKRSYVEQIYNGKTDTYEPKGNPITKYYWDYRIPEEDYPDILKTVRIPKGKIDDEAKVRHVLINEIWTKSGKRGLSDLYSSREWFRVFREFMEGRAAINAAAQAISYLRKIKGSPSTVARFSGKLGDLAVGNAADSDPSVRRLTRPVPGAIYDSNEAVDLEWMKTDTGAQNAKEDARLILMSAGAGVGTMVHYFGEGGDANLATAQSMELPMVKSYEDWQQFMEDFFLGWFEYTLRVANPDQDVLEIQKELTRIGFTFPPIISQDVVKYTTSWAQIVRDIAPNNMAVREQAIRACLSIMGVANIDGLMPEVEAEMQKAEMLRQQQQQALLAAQSQLANGVATNGTNGNGQKPPVAGQIPNAGLDPNMKRIAAGRSPKAANGPKSA